jgi:hypothetical protein
MTHSKCSRTARVYHALEVLGPVESLLLLEQEHIAGYGNTADSLAVGSANRLAHVPRCN